MTSTGLVEGCHGCEEVLQSGQLAVQSSVVSYNSIVAGNCCNFASLQGLPRFPTLCASEPSQYY